MSSATPNDRLVRYICVAQHDRDASRVLQVTVHREAWAVCPRTTDDAECAWRLIPPSEMHSVAMHWEELVRERREPIPQ